MVPLQVNVWLVAVIYHSAAVQEEDEQTGGNFFFIQCKNPRKQSVMIIVDDPWSIEILKKCILYLKNK